MRPRSCEPLRDRIDGVGRQHLEHLDGAGIAGRVDLAQVPQPDAAGDDQAGDRDDPGEVDEVLDRPVRAALAFDAPTHR